MKAARMTFTVVVLMALGLLCVWHIQPRAVAEDKKEYVGSDTCKTCHAEKAKQWALTSHRATAFNKDVAKQGCEGCHGPGSKHVEGGGDTSQIIRYSKLKPNQVADQCMKCHTQEHVTLWQTSTHSRAKLSCLSCHDVHSEGADHMLKTLDNGKLNLSTLTRTIQQEQLNANTAKLDSDEQQQINDKIKQLTDQKSKLQQSLKGTETAYKKTAEPYLCFNCHKQQEAQGKMISHHPIAENKMNCSDCHNPHGGPNGMLKDVSVNETCAKCHAEKVGPYVYEHPPVADDCTNCHNPHGAVNNNMLVQKDPFVCMKCHVFPHAANPAGFAQRLTGCLGCHNVPHGSNVNARFSER